MIRDRAEGRFEAWVLSEVGRARTRVRELKTRYPTAPQRELAQRLIDEKKRWAAMGGAASGFLGLLTLPADLALVSYLQLSLLVDIATLCDRNLKSARAREELWELFKGAQGAVNLASRSSPHVVGLVAERLLATRALRLLGRALPVVAAPLTAAVNARALQVVGDEALRWYEGIPQAVSLLRSKR
jgi:hypothetical protein